MTISIPENHGDSQQLKPLSLLYLNDKNSLAKRFRALFSLKHLNSRESIEIIAKGFTDTSALLKHEVAYVLGQMKNKLALPFLEQVLSDTKQEAMVRHEAAEAIGAIGETSSLSFLQDFINDKEQVVKETVILAISSLQHEHESELGTERFLDDLFNIRVFGSIDPAPAAKKEYTTLQLRGRLLDASLSLFERYRAMFALRNRGDTEAVFALAEGFHDDSALFRHEIAYVFGQMQHEASVPSLIQVLANEGELSMVRHEVNVFN